MPINFDPNSLNNVFDKNFGTGSFNAGLSNAAKAARLKQQASFAKSDFLKAVSAYQAKQKKDQTYMDKYGMTYDQYQAKKEQDKLNQLQDKYQVLDNGLTSDQASQMRSKAEAQGRGGHQPSYDQQRKEAQNSAKNSSDLTSYDTSKMTDHNKELVQKLQDKQLAAQAKKQSSSKKSSPSLFDKIGSGLKGIGSEIGAAATAAEQFVNPFDKVSADQAVKNYMNRTPSKTRLEVERGANRAVDSASLGLMNNLDKKLNHRTPAYTSHRAFGQGGGTDMITSGLGYLVPGVGMTKGVRALGLGAKEATGLAKFAQLAKEGAITGGALTGAEQAGNWALNPKDQSIGNSLLNIGLGTGLGAVGDPLLHGIGQGAMNSLAKFAKGEVPTFTGKPSQSIMDGLIPKDLNSNLRTTVQKPNSNNLFNGLLNPKKSTLKTVEPKNKDLLLSLNPTQPLPNANSPFKDTAKAIDNFFSGDDKGAFDRGLAQLYKKDGFVQFNKPESIIAARNKYPEWKEVKQSDGSSRFYPTEEWKKQWVEQTQPPLPEQRNTAKEIENAFKEMGKGFRESMDENRQKIIDQQGYLEYRNPKAAELMRKQFPAFREEIQPDGSFRFYPPSETKLTHTEKQYQNEFNDAVKQQMEYLKSSMGKGVDRGTTSNGELGNFKEVTGTFNVSRNPKWYQDFYKANGRKPNNSELQQLAQEHVLGGFQDQYGDIPAFVPKKIQNINDQIDEALTNIQAQPELEPVLKPYVEALKQEKAQAEEEYNQFLMKSNLQQFGKNEPKSTNIGPAPKKVTKAPLPKLNPLDAPFKPGDTLPDTRSQIGTKTTKERVSIPEAANKGYIKTVDNLHRLSQFDKQVEKVLGRNLNTSESTHTLGLNSRGSDMISHQILTENMVNKNGKAIGKSLKDITMQVPKGKLKDFEDYLVNKHAITRMKRGEKVFPDQMKMTTGKAEEKVKQYEANNPKFEELAKQYYDYNKQLGQHWLVDTGILNKDQWEGYLKANPHYVPNNRIFSELEKPKFGNNAKKGFANQTNPVKKAIGSQRQIVSPIESTIEHTAQYVKTAKRNEVMQNLIKSIQKDPKAFEGWAEIVPTEKGSVSFLDSLDSKLKNEGIDSILEEFNKAFDQKPDLTKGNIVRGLLNGQPVHVKVNDPQLLDALTNLQPKAQHIIIDSMAKLTRTMKTLTTGINPVFSLTRNMFRDIPTAFVNSPTTKNPFKFSYDLLDAFTSVLAHPVGKSKTIEKFLPSLSKLANNRAELYKQFKNVGGGHASPISSDINLLAQSKRSILPREKGLINGTKHFGGKLIGGLENLNNAIESAPRLGEFKRLNGNNYNAKMKALYEANDVTVNFNKYGNWSKAVDSTVPYFNAAVQGLDKAGRVFFSPSASASQKAWAVGKAFSAITVPTIMLYSINHNNPDYQKVSNYIKDTNLLIPKGDGTFYKIPIPRELGVVFGSSVERLMRSWVDQDPKAFQDFGTNLWNNFKPPVRTTFAPLNDLRANKNFMDTPIVPGDLANLPPQYQYDSKTSEVSKAIGKLFNVSPMKSDYLIKSYGGVIGELGIPATTKDTTIADTLKQKVTADPVFSNDILRNFYDQKTQLDQAHTALTKQGVNTPQLNESQRKLFSSANTQIGKVRKQIKQTQNNQNLTRQQRVDQVRKLQEFMNQLALQANKSVR